tara:strand:- start:14 stop:874 length:861 start_codon:yes stop_codon:yes gene_type:complete
MKLLKYFFEFLFILCLFIIFKIVGRRLSNLISSKIGEILGPLFRSKKLIEQNIKKTFPDLSDQKIKNIEKKMWSSYGMILSDYVFLNSIRKKKSKELINVEGHHILRQIEKSSEPVVFVSGHFDNFELMAMYIEMSNINLAAVYRPLNNIFLNPLMENIRKKSICKNQIKKGIKGVKELLKYFKKGYSIALMIDQRVSEGIRIKFFGHDALTTTIPAQFVKKFNCKVVPVFIERDENSKFKIRFLEPMVFEKNDKIENITLKLNHELEKMINFKPHQWIWTHNRWK